MSINKGMMSSNTDMSVYDFDIDVYAVPSNSKCEMYFTPKVYGLKQDWNGTCWMNPPYGREIGKWVRKAYIRWTQE